MPGPIVTWTGVGAGTVRCVVTRVAIDVGPLVGPRTGIGEATASMVRSLGALDGGPQLVPYRTSFRAPPEVGVRRLPVPAALALHCWARLDRPRFDRRLGHPAVIHGTNYVVPPSRHARLVTVYDCWFLDHPSEVHPDVRLAGDVLRRAVRTGAVVHASSHATAARVRSLLDAPRVEVIHLGALPATRSSTSPGAAQGDTPAGVATGELPTPSGTGAGGRMVLALGTVERRKNLPSLVEAFGLARRRIDGLELVIAGAPGDDIGAVTASIDRLEPKARGAVTLVGRVDDATRAALYARAAVLAYPSLDEGFGFPLLEAMDAGVPVVASTAGSIPEIAGEAAILSDPTDAEGLAEGLYRVIADDHTRSALIDAGRRRVAMFEWATTARRLADLYAALAMERRG